MKKYIYVFATGERPELIIGTCSDLDKAVKVFKGMPRIDNSHDRLVYCEGLKDEVESSNRLKEIFAMTREQKELLIEAVNPNWIELVPGKNFDLIDA